MHVKFLDTLDWGILIAYFLILIAIGVWASSKRKKGSSLFLAERSLRWHHIGFSMWGTNVGPSMLIASASAGFTTGIVSGNYAWYAFVFICLLAFVFAPRYLGARITTVYPQYSGMVYNCYDIDFLVSIDFIRRWCSDSSGIRYTDVAVRFDLIDYFGILHNARRIEGCCLHECLSDDSVDSCFSYTGYRRNL